MVSNVDSVLVVEATADRRRKWPEPSGGGVWKLRQKENELLWEKVEGTSHECVKERADFLAIAIPESVCAF